MKIKNLLSKPFVLSLLLLVIWWCVTFGSNMLFYSLYKGYFTTLFFYPLFWAISALIISLIYTKTNKELLSKNQMTKISIYSFTIVFLFFIIATSFLFCYFLHDPLHSVIIILVSILPVILIILSGLCTYPALDFGGKVFNTDLAKDTEKTKLKDCLLIIFFILLGICCNQYNKLVLESLRNPIMNYMEEKGYVHENNPEKFKVQQFTVETNLHANKLIINKKDDSTYNIQINKPVELDFLSKQKVFELRKKYAAMTPKFIKKNYKPNEIVFGQIQDKKPWWGLNGMMFGGSGRHSIDGLSEESRSINNPLLLFMVDPNFWFVDLKLSGAEIYPKPVSMTFQPSKKTIKVVYDITSYNKEMNNYLTKSAHKTFGDSNEYSLVGLNARDFGYNFAYAYSTKNISFDQPDNNLSLNIQQLKDFLHTGGSCGYPGGCNNLSPEQKYLDFTETKLPAQISIKLWKKVPRDKNAPADLYYIIDFK